MMYKKSIRSLLALGLVAVTLLSSCATKKPQKTEDPGASSLSPSVGQSLYGDKSTPDDQSVANTTSKDHSNSLPD
ncbi:MAG: hypothetical protein IJY89_05240, partial [Clostridia bacterium]|nr:hypothetical protein [Clostridia bacterium]